MQVASWPLVINKWWWWWWWWRWWWRWWWCSTSRILLRLPRIHSICAVRSHARTHLCSVLYSLRRPATRIYRLRWRIVVDFRPRRDYNRQLVLCFIAAGNETLPHDGGVKAVDRRRRLALSTDANDTPCDSICNCANIGRRRRTAYLLIYLLRASVIGI